jgi:acyl-CoA reductase-like NAD-dependent aldehyde dehydrogenase
MKMSDFATHLKQNYIGGQWVDSKGGKSHDVINPATEEALDDRPSPRSRSASSA